MSYSCRVGYGEPCVGLGCTKGTRLVLAADSPLLLITIYDLILAKIQKSRYTMQ